MPRAIIQDSDDDDDDDGNFASEFPMSEKASAPRDYLIPDASLRSQKSALGGTSSTEAIRQEILAAHRDVLEKSAAPPFALNRCGSSSRVHRRNTTLETGYDSSPTKRRRRNTIMPYGSLSRRDQSTFEDDAFEMVKKPVVVDEEARLDSMPGGVEIIAPQDAVQEPSGRSEEQHIIDGSLQPDFAGHEPRMFGTSDTVPDGTSDQQHLIDAAIAHIAHMRDSTHGDVMGIQERESLGNDPSPPWSDYIRSPENAHGTKETTEVSTTFNSTPGPNPILRRSRTFGNPRTSLQQSQSEYPGPQQIPSSATTKKTWASVAPASSQSSNSVKKRRREQTDDEDELAHFEAPFMNTTRKVNYSIQDSIHAVRASRAAKTQQETSSEPLNSDDVLDGLPTERYKPRPSRSRSSRLAIQEPIDYSVNPEKAAKKKLKRRKTVDAATIGRVKSSVSEKGERMVVVGFSPTSSERALKECKDDLDKAAEALGNADHREATHPENADKFDIIASNCLEASADQEVKATIPRAQGSPIVVIEAPKNLANIESRDSNTIHPKKGGGRPPRIRPADIPEKIKVLPNVTHDAAESHDEVKAEFHAENTNLEIEDHRQSTNSLERRPSSTVNPTPPSSAQQLAMTAESNKLEERAAEIPEAQESLPRKRGRGLLRKQKPPEPTIPKRHEATESGMQATRGAEMPQAPNLEEPEKQTRGAEMPQAPSLEEPEKQTQGHGSIRRAPVSTPHAVTSSQSRSALQRSTANALETPGGAPAKAASRPSANTNKVSYRVGLSKRARIAPLLKIVKK